MNKTMKKLFRVLLYCIGIAILLKLLLFLTAYIMVGYFGISFAKETPYYSPSFFVDSFWYDNGSAFVTDSDGECYGIMDGVDEIMYFHFIDTYYDQYNSVDLFSSGADALPDAVRRIENAKLSPEGMAGLHLEYIGRIDLCDRHRLDLDSKENELFSYDYSRIDLDESGFLFREAEDWPPEMLQWMEQREQSK